MPVDLIGGSDILMSEPLGKELDIPYGLEMQESRGDSRDSWLVRRPYDHAHG